MRYDQRFAVRAVRAASGLTAPTQAAVGVTGAAAVAAAEAATDDYLFGFAFLFPVAAAAAGGNRWVRYLVVVFAALTWTAADTATREWGTSAAAWNAFGRLATLVTVAAVVTGLRSETEDAERMAMTDPLTGVANSRGLRAALRREGARQRRGAGPLTVVLVDVDGLKDVNGAVGHSGGDRVLAAVAAGVSAHIRDVDVVARHGGDEFVVVLPDTPAAGARQWATSMRRDVLTATSAAGHAVTVTVGAVTWPSDAPGADTMLSAADRLLSRAKASGRNSIVTAVVGGARRREKEQA